MSLPAPPAFLNEEQIKLFDKLADRIAKYRLTTPAVLFLESVRPLNFVGSQAMLFFAPMVHSLFTAREYDLLQQAMERRETMSYFVDLLEAKEVDAAKREKEFRAARKAERKAKREVRSKNRPRLLRWLP
jgi:hypothetical protein